MDDSNLGRHRQSIADIQQELHAIFRGHSQCYDNPEGVASLPVRYLSDVFDTYREEYGVELLTEDEMASFMQIVDASPGVEATPDTILQLVAMRTCSGQQIHSEGHPVSTEDWIRGRADERNLYGGHSRSSSNSSTGEHHRHARSSRSSSRPPSRAAGGIPRTPGAKDSPFDAQKRQRSTPLGPVAPSSWTRRPAAPGRRKSDASNHGRPMSDSESPTTFNLGTGDRSRAPSNPTTPGSQQSPTTLHGLIGSPPLGVIGSRPHSRAQSQSHPPFSHLTPPQFDLSSAMCEAFEETVTQSPMPRISTDSDSDESEDSVLGLVFDRSTTSSAASMEPLERVEALQRVNSDLAKKVVEAERTLQRKLADHEVELEEMEARLEEARSELSAAKREEKELRSKERSNQTQISALESEIAKVQRILDNSRTMYNSLQRQYQEQLNESEDLRNTLRRKDEEIRSFRESLSLQQMETNKYLKENKAYEERIVLLEQDLALTQQAQASLDEQKQENLMLKETIDRMRFDMDELRAGLTSNALGAGSGTNSAPGSVSRSLGAELLGKLRDDDQWMDDEDEPDSAATLRVLGIEGQDDDTGDEDIVQTIITRTKKRGFSKANKDQAFILKKRPEYAEAYTQHDPGSFTKASITQTESPPEIPTTSIGTHTDSSLVSVSTLVQTHVSLQRVTSDVEVQTEEPSTSRSPSPQDDDETLASSSSTVLPPTPKAKPVPLDFLSPNSPTDLPPSYNQVTSETSSHDLLQLLDTEDLSFSHVPDLQKRRDLRIAVETLRIWHSDIKIPICLPVGFSAETLEEWRTLKAEVGIGCKVLDRALKDAATNEAISRPQKNNRFYNIYNTYVYGGDGIGGKVSWSGLASHALLCVGASAVVFFAMSPFLAHQYVVPGGPTYYDRTAWSTFNTMHPAGEGFSSERNIAVWNFLGRLGGGAARIARGWPT
ncbi:hypothetical protein F5148DRAFT_181687 [Russula earlei]|uniref:Uncharacterized protein n=1 Tax=Russula earlei TaxID=71964 RepID=A0ACC0UL07_9AGAM|nr:hypothetical protein F5148DRAFT_181687 [Russula earlei]